MSTAVISSSTLYEPTTFPTQGTRMEPPPFLADPIPQETIVQEDVEKKKKKKKGMRHAVGLIVIDPTTKKVLMMSSKKRENAYVLPKGDCQMEPEAERYEDTAFRVLMESGIKAHSLSRRIAVYSDANKKGKIIGHHAMYECTDFTLLPPPANFERSRVWVAYDVALRATEDRPLSHLALKNSTLRHQQ
ncbi:hypothetical protein BC941DRAFT_428523 [Chlamydoabsidia padenii]|nr:hypothetical protein BC941DRAFT_428523 [Chlamydoabsidia padenii]